MGLICFSPYSLSTNPYISTFKNVSQCSPWLLILSATNRQAPSSSSLQVWITFTSPWILSLSLLHFISHITYRLTFPNTTFFRICPCRESKWLPTDPESNPDSSLGLPRLSLSDFALLTNPVSYSSPNYTFHSVHQKSSMPTPQPPRGFAHTAIPTPHPHSPSRVTHNSTPL